NALAAAALARSYGVPAKAVRDGLRNVRVGAHKIELVAEHGGVRFVDDSKATNPHAADASLRAYGSAEDVDIDDSTPVGAGEHGKVVWIAGGQAKGTTF